MEEWGRPVGYSVEGSVVEEGSLSEEKNQESRKNL